MPLSKTQIDKLGDRLRTADPPTDGDLQLLEEVRRDRRAVRNQVASALIEIGCPAPAGRLKTTNSIVAKLRRQPTMKLSQIQDVAGLRVVRDMSWLEQDRLVWQVVGRFPGAKILDRRERPSHGYRAAHVVVSHEGRRAEVQVRTLLQNRWALLIERLADRWGQTIKYGGGPVDPAKVFAGTLSRAEVVGLVHTLGEEIARYEAGAGVYAARRAYGLDRDLQLEDATVDLRNMIDKAMAVLSEVPL